MESKSSLDPLSAPEGEKSNTFGLWAEVYFPAIDAKILSHALEPFNSQLANSESECWKKEGRRKLKYPFRLKRRMLKDKIIGSEGYRHYYLP